MRSKIHYKRSNKSHKMIYVFYNIIFNKSIHLELKGPQSQNCKSFKSQKSKLRGDGKEMFTLQHQFIKRGGSHPGRGEIQELQRTVQKVKRFLAFIFYVVLLYGPISCIAAAATAPPTNTRGRLIAASMFFYYVFWFFGDNLLSIVFVASGGY